MTVRWKPLIALTCLFLLFAVGGAGVFFFAMPRRVDDLIPKARAYAKEKRFSFAQIQYRQALQVDPKNVAIHEEMADLIRAWIEQDPPKEPEALAKLHAQYIRTLMDAAKAGKSQPSPRRKLLAEALGRDDANDALQWANELIALDAKDVDANYVKALEALDGKSGDRAAAREFADVLLAAEPNTFRSLWIKARLAEASSDDAARDEALAAARSAPAATTPAERLARLRIRLMDLSRTQSPKALAEQVRQFGEEARALASDGEPSPARIRILSESLERVQKHLVAVAAKDPAAKAETTALADSLEGVAETIYSQARATSGQTDLRVHLAYAEHLIFRDQPQKGLDVAAEALKLPIAKAPTYEGTAAGLRETAIKAALAQDDDPKKFEKAEPYIKELLTSPSVRYSGMGHFFKGLVALDKSGLIASAGAASGTPPAPVDADQRNLAVTELRLAAAALPEASTAQALYGVVLILTGESGLGRQYLQAAYRLGGEDDRLEPRYQVWAAWSILQAGYPEEAEPILAKLRAAVAKGELPPDLSPTLHLLQGEAYEARGTDDQLKLARAEFQKALDEGHKSTPALQLRLAQLDFRLGDRKSGSSRLAAVKADGNAGPEAAAAAERLAVQTLLDAGDKAKAIEALAAARRKYPDSDELVELDANLKMADKDPAAAEQILKAFVEAHPDRQRLAMRRALLLAGPLKNPEAARAIFVSLAEKAQTSDPLVQLAIFDLTRKDTVNAAKTVAQIRARWENAAAADLLDAQIAVASGDLRAAAVHLESALTKDPNNKAALLWKALIDDRNGAKANATQALEAILKDKPTKEIEDGLSLTQAAKWALADIALENQDLDTAIKRFEGLTDSGGDIDRAARWKLVIARAGKGDAAKAKAEVAALLASPKTTLDERVQAADFYRRQGDDAGCLAQLDAVLKADPTHSGAASYKALVLASKGQPEKAAALLQSVLKSGKPQASNMYLLLAAAENLAKPRETAPRRALAALDEGLAKNPKSVELTEAKYEVLKLLKDPRAVAFVEDAAKADPSVAMKGTLVDVYRKERAFDKAEAVLRELVEQAPKDARLAASLVGMVATRAAEAAERGDPEAAKRFDADAGELIRKYRITFPHDTNFPQAEWEMAARKGDFARARALGDEIANMDKASPAGPLLHARLSAMEGRTEEVARAYDEALTRSPARVDIRLALAQADLALGKVDETLKQTKFVLDSEHDQPTALLLKAQALVSMEGTPAQKTERRTEAAKLIRDAITANPNFLEAYHLLAELRILEGDRPKALNALREALKVNPNDDTGLSSLVFHLCESRGPNAPADPKDVTEATALAEEFAKRDDRGVFALASAIGFQRAGRLDLALPWAEKASKKIDRAGVHLAYGGILLAKAESMHAAEAARPLFLKAVEEYDAVLKTQPDSIEAVNNKAWILHRYLNRNAEALAVAEAYAKRADPAKIPAEFHDTLGSIQEAANQQSRAEESYDEGLRKAPDHATLNYHMGKLLAGDPSRAAKAVTCLEKAKAAKTKLAPEMAKDLDGLIKSVSP